MQPAAASVPTTAAVSAVPRGKPQHQRTMVAKAVAPRGEPGSDDDSAWPAAASASVATSASDPMSAAGTTGAARASSLAVGNCTAVGREVAPEYRDRSSAAAVRSRHHAGAPATIAPAYRQALANGGSSVTASVTAALAQAIAPPTAADPITPATAAARAT